MKRGAEIRRGAQARLQRVWRKRNGRHAAEIFFSLLLVCALVLITDKTAAADNLVDTSQLPDSSFIYDAQISDLENADSYVDGQTVQVTGEVVGDCIASDYSSDYCWITLQATDGSYSEISVYMSKSSASAIDTYGEYGKTGTILQVRGTFWLARSDHEGVTEIEAESVSVVSQGSTEESVFNKDHFIVGAVLVAIGAVLSLLYWWLSERRR